jgi:hypothetical protein
MRCIIRYTTQNVSCKRHKYLLQLYISAYYNACDTLLTDYIYEVQCSDFRLRQTWTGGNHA